MSFTGRGRKRTDLIEKDNNKNNRGNRGGRARPDARKNKPIRNNNELRKDNTYRRSTKLVNPNKSVNNVLNDFPSVKELSEMSIMEMESSILKWCSSLKTYFISYCQNDCNCSVKTLFNICSELIKIISLIATEDMQECINLNLGDVLHDVMIQEISVIHNEKQAKKYHETIITLASTLDTQINIINSLRDELTSKYNIDIHTSLLRIVMTYETPKSEYQRYLLQICHILLAHMFIEREISSNDQIQSLLVTCQLIHPGLGLYRYYLGGLKCISGSYLDAVYYYMSAIDCKITYDCREQLDLIFDRAYNTQYQLEQDKKKGKTIDQYSLRVFVLRFIRAIKCIWTNIDLDCFSGYTKSLGTTLNTLIAQWSNNSIQLSSKILTRLMSITLMTVERCMTSPSTSDHYDKSLHNFENKKTSMIYISNRDMKGTLIYSSLCLLYTLLASLCESYVLCKSLREKLLPAIALGFHYLYMKENIFLYSLNENEYDSIVIAFVQQCAPFFRLASSFTIVSFPTDFESCDIDRLSEEYVDLLGSVNLDFIVRTCCSTQEYSSTHSEEESANAIRESYIQYIVESLLSMQLLEIRHSKVYAVTESSELPIDSSITESELCASYSPVHQDQQIESVNELFTSQLQREQQQQIELSQIEENNENSSVDSNTEVVIETNTSDSLTNSLTESESEANSVSSSETEEPVILNKPVISGNQRKPFGNRRRTKNATLDTNQYLQLRKNNRLYIDPQFVVILDACNIAMHHGDNKKFSTRGIEIVLDFFDKMDVKEVFGIIPRYYTTERGIHKEEDKNKLPVGEDFDRLLKLVDNGRIHRAPPRDYDDSYMIDYAIEKQAIIVTNDYYRDYLLKKGDTNAKIYLESHCLSYLFVNDVFRPNPDFKCPEYYLIDDE